MFVFEIIFAKMVILENNRNENLNAKMFDPFPRDRNPFFKTLPDFRHMSHQIYHIWNSPLGDPLIILPLYQNTFEVSVIENAKTKINSGNR